jgi:hypothetical protein
LVCSAVMRIRRFCWVASATSNPAGHTKYNIFTNIFYLVCSAVMRIRRFCWVASATSNPAGHTKLINN